MREVTFDQREIVKALPDAGSEPVRLPSFLSEGGRSGWELSCCKAGPALRGLGRQRGSAGFPLLETKR